MAKSFHQLSPKAQMAVFGVLAVLTVGAGWQVLISPAREELATRTARLAEVTGQLTAAQATAKRLDQARKEVAEMERTLRMTTATLPDIKDPAEVLDMLHQLAVESSVDLSTFGSKAIATKTQYSEWPIELNIEGGYHAVARFFDRVASMPRLMSVADLRLKVKTNPNARGSIVASCIATTYVFKKDAAPAASATGGTQ